ncbi:MAG: acetolactate synthase large subunit [Methanomassiliicoccales archaeon]
MKASRLLVECLKAEGVDRIFGIPGEENLDVMDDIHQAGMEFVLTRHEQAAAFMAATVGRLTGRPGVCLSTLGPGATNLVSGVADAYLSNLPMVALVAQAGAVRRDPPQKQVLDLMAMFRPLTKRAMDVGGPDDVPRSVNTAFKLATAERSGPVMLQLPEDVMKKEAMGTHMRSPKRRTSKAADVELAKVRDVLSSSERPLVLAGHGVLREGAVSALIKFCEAWNLPVGCTWMAAGAVPLDHHLSLGTVGMRNSDLVKDCYEEADAVLLLGFDSTEFQPQHWNRGKAKRIAYLGRSEPIACRNLQLECTALGDLPDSLGRLTHSAIPGNEWHSLHRLRLMDDLYGEAVGPKALVQAMRRCMDRDDIMVSDVGAHLIWLAKYYPAFGPNTLLLQNGLISMGVAIPSAIAAKMVHPERRVCATVGDGGFLMSAAELETAKRLGVNFVTVIFNDNGLGLIREKMDRGLGRSSNVDLGNPDIPTFARSFGAEGFSVSGKDLEAVLKDCLDRDALAVIEVKVDYSHNRHLF